MTPYERGYAAALKAAAEACDMEHVEPVSTEDEAYNAALVHARQAILSLPIVGEATNPGEQELPAAAAKALPSESRSPSGRDATEGTSAQQPARPGPSQGCVMVPRETMRLIRLAFLPTNHNKMRVADPSVVAAAKEFIALAAKEE